MPTTRIQLDAALIDDGLPEMETLLDGQDHPKIAGRDDWSIRMGRFWSGAAADVEVIDLCNGLFSILILPTRGMGVWRADYNGLKIGWNAPVRQPVHPRFVNPYSRNGLGWLEGFNELICRCGLSFNGPPGHDEGARSPLESDLTLHGRIANLPAGQVEMFVNEEEETIGVTGVVDEFCLFGSLLRLRSTLSTRIGSSSFTIVDEITNCGPDPAEMQLLYHTNIGSPFLEAGSQLECAAERVVPRDSQAAEGIQSHIACLGPTPGFAEQVYFYSPLSDASGRSTAMLKNAAGNLGISLDFNVRELPCFSFWKCTQDERSGYVAGLEPATNFPNFKAFERHHGRVVDLAPDQTYRSQLEFHVHDTAESVNTVSERIRTLQGNVKCRMDCHPAAPFCPID